MLENLGSGATIAGYGDEAYLTWGFPIYRTAYGGLTDQHGETLIDTIHQQVAEELEHYRSSSSRPRRNTGSTNPIDAPNPAAPSTLLSLFRLDVHSDPDILEGADIDRVRQIYMDNLPSTTDRHRSVQWQLFLLADAEVLAAVARGDSWVKLCDPLYKPENYTIKNSRMGRGLWFLGYIWMTTRSLLCLWNSLEREELALLAPPLTGQKFSEVWNGYMAAVLPDRRPL